MRFSTIVPTAVTIFAASVLAQETGQTGVASILESFASSKANSVLSSATQAASAASDAADDLLSTVRQQPSPTATEDATGIVTVATGTSLATGPGIATHSGSHSSGMAVPSGGVVNTNGTKVNGTSMEGELTGGALAMGVHMFSGLAAASVFAYGTLVGF
ncbi:hypothetical protein NliqN6_3033 [Naganishia liquefaciens]|uniref:Uncharacterized protein n=1 Tax=Naganishia liquefaciens TaxID=104408 RepID=A0A8H3TTG9_9TREE|nr:hypothetical protein NliqN6_3033 [Naganishia liquefaciens]